MLRFNRTASKNHLPLKKSDGIEASWRPTWFRKHSAQFENPHIVVLGAGFGGLTFCQTLNRSAARLTVVDRQNHHLFQPLLYQVAAAGLSAPEIAQPIRSILSGQSNVTVLLDQVTGFDLAAKTVRLEKNTLTYDYLVLALGGCTSYFGHPEWEQFAPGLKSLDDALRIRRDILLAFEKAENTSDPVEHDRLMTIVVIGGGPTGVELAGAFAELTRTVLQRDFKRIDPAQARVVMIEAAPRVLTQFSSKLSASAEQQLKKLGVEVRTSTKVKAISQGRVDLENGETIFAENIVWAAGVSASPLTQKLGVELDRAGRVKVNPDLHVPGHPEVFALGDMALVLGEDGRPVPGISPAAMQMARHVARIIEDEQEVGGKSPRPPFRYRDKGSMATIGRSAAVAKMGPFEFSGFPAWLAWLGVHLIFLIGFRNKLAVLLQWGYSYFTYKRGARIITGRNEIEPQLQSALGEVQLLSDVLQICVSCQKIQDAKGQWHGVEEYIHSHNQTDYTVSLCPACTGKVLADAPPVRNGAGGQPDQSGSAEKGFRVSSNNGNALLIAVKPRCKATLP